MQQIVEIEGASRATAGRAAASRRLLREDTLRGQAVRLQRRPVGPARSGPTRRTVRERRQALGVRAVYKSVDTCAAEFEAFTPYYYSTYEQEAE